MNRKKLLATLLALSAAVYSSAPGLALPETASVGVRSFKQQQTAWCWAASGVAVLDRFGQTVSQCDFVKTTKGTSSCDNLPGDQYAIQYGLSQYGYQSTVAYPVPYSTIQSEIAVYKRPFMAMQIQWNGLGHAVVVSGYQSAQNGNSVIFMDPQDGYFYGELYDSFLNNDEYRWHSTVYKVKAG